VVEQQSVHISAEWLLLLGCLLRAAPGVAVTWGFPGLCCTLTSAEVIGASPIAADAAMVSGATRLSFICFPPI
jgi:hypothetical protein